MSFALTILVDTTLIHVSMRLEFIEQRNADFMESYNRVLKRYGRYAPFVKKSTLIAEALQEPAKRFYVTHDQCVIIIRQMIKGKKTYIKSPQKIEMYNEILRRVKKELSLRPTRGLYGAIDYVLSNPAPKFYMTKGTAWMLFNKIIKQK